MTYDYRTPLNANDLIDGFYVVRSKTVDPTTGKLMTADVAHVHGASGNRVVSRFFEQRPIPVEIFLEKWDVLKMIEAPSLETHA